MDSRYINCNDFTINGKCSGCGSCCTDFLPVSTYDISRIKSYVKKHKIKEQRVNITSGFDLTCPFRDNANRKCLIYDVRPEICRSFKCDFDKDTLIDNRNRLCKQNTVVSFRKVFFDSDESETALFYIMHGLINLSTS